MRSSLSIHDFHADLAYTAQTLVSNHRGILAADESIGTIGIENTEENRRRYREMLLCTAPGDLSMFLGGVILFEETLYQTTTNGRSFASLLDSQGIFVGVKVDKGTVVIPNTASETITEGMDRLANRCREYYCAGARFTKWRCTFTVSDRLPSALAVEENAEVLARYAAISQQNGLVPIVEPEILMDGDYHLQRAIEVHTEVLAVVIKKLHDHRVFMQGLLLKPSMVLAGATSPNRPTAKQIAHATLDVLSDTVPPSIPGIVFLSGGQSERDATENLNMINRLQHDYQPHTCRSDYGPEVHAVKTPWALSFSYGRALQDSALRVWAGSDENVEKAREVFINRARECTMAVQGKWDRSVAGQKEVNGN